MLTFMYIVCFYQSGKKVERRESTRLQSAAKLIRNLSKSKDVNQV